ncbi:hypothetical protein COV61_00830, partial [Candidatus Micrarchaeota archaeon CG11_big_fil_rev_8_21_14_0_20_47_5]
MKGKNCECGSECSCGCRDGIGKAIVLGVIVLLVFGIGYMANSSPKEFVLNANSNPQEHTISVSGEAGKKVAPDEVQISFTVETSNIDPKTAEKKNADIVANVKEALLKNGITESEISTGYYSLYPEYETIYELAPYYNTRQGNLTGYKASHQISVKTGKLDKAGVLADAIVEAGVANVNSITFGLKEETRKAIEEELLAKASANARD